MSLNRAWSRDAISILIDVYDRNPCLFDTQSPDCHNRKLNRDALDEMVQAVEQFHPDVTAADCKKKYQCLRGQYLAECRKIFDSKRSGAGSSSVYKPKLWCYDRLNFLRDYVKVRNGTFVGGNVQDDVAEEIDKIDDEDKEDEDMIIEYLEEDDVIEDSDLNMSSSSTFRSSAPPPTRKRLLSSPSSQINIKECPPATGRSSAPPASNLQSSATQPPAIAGCSKRYTTSTPMSGQKTTSTPMSGQKKRKFSETSSKSTDQTRESTPTPTGRGKPDNSAMIASALSKLADKPGTQKDDYDIFGNFVSSRLRKLGKGYSEEVEHEIINLIFSAEKQKTRDEL